VPLSSLNTLLVLGPLNELFLVLIYSSWVTGATSATLPSRQVLSDDQDTCSYTIYKQSSGRLNIVCTNFLSTRILAFASLSESL